MPSYKAEVQYLKEVIKAYQLAISFITDETEGLVNDEVDDQKLSNSIIDMNLIIHNNVMSSSVKHNRTRGEHKENVSRPTSWTDKQLKGLEPL